MAEGAGPPHPRPGACGLVRLRLVDVLVVLALLLVAVPPVGVLGEGLDARDAGQARQRVRNGAGATHARRRLLQSQRAEEQPPGDGDGPPIGTGPPGNGEGPGQQATTPITTTRELFCSSDFERLCVGQAAGASAAVSNVTDACCAYLDSSKGITNTGCECDRTTCKHDCQEELPVIVAACHAKGYGNIRTPTPLNVCTPLAEIGKTHDVFSGSVKAESLCACMEKVQDATRGKACREALSALEDDSASAPYFEDYSGGRFSKRDQQFDYATKLFPLLTFVCERAQFLHDDSVAELVSGDEGLAHISTWSKEMLAVYVFAEPHESSLGTLGTGFEAGDAKILYTNNVDGSVYLSLSDVDMRTMGIGIGTIHHVERNRRVFMNSFAIPLKQYLNTLCPPQENDSNDSKGPSRATDPYCKDLTHPLPPHDVYLSFKLLRVVEIDVVRFFFTAIFELHMSWHDPRHFSNCQNSGASGVMAVDVDGGVCSNYWKPTVLFENALSLEDQEPILLSTTGLTNVLGEDHGLGVGYVDSKNVNISEIEHSFAHWSGTYEGKFSANLTFHRFPHDYQGLEVQVRVNEPRDEVRLHGSMYVDESLLNLQKEGQKDALPSWLIDETDVTRRTFDDSLDLGKVQPNTPYAEYLRTQAASTRTRERDLLAFTATVRRQPDFCVWNYVLMIVMPVMLSWLTFGMQFEDLSTRISLSLTVLVAIGVFQIVLNDRLPTTAYNTPMHNFMIASTVLVVLTSLENAIVCTSHHTNRQLIETIEKLQGMSKSKKVEQAVTKLQRSWRRSKSRRKAMSSNGSMHGRPANLPAASAQQQSGIAINETSGPDRQTSRAWAIRVESVSADAAKNPSTLNKAPFTPITPGKGGVLLASPSELHLWRSESGPLFQLWLRMRDAILRPEFKSLRMSKVQITAVLIVNYLDMASMLIFPLSYALCLALIFYW